MERCENSKNGIRGNLNILRYEVFKNKNENINDPCKKIMYFILKINTRIEKLLNKSVCKNANIVNQFYLLNNINPNVNNLYFLDINNFDINKFKTIDEDINILELMFKHNLESLHIENERVFNYVSLNINRLLSGEELESPDIKKAFKELEMIYKLISKFYKVHGYLKEKRKNLNK